jgi:hypothetical protein
MVPHDRGATLMKASVLHVRLVTDTRYEKPAALRLGQAFDSKVFGADG